jgi:hypothetical protein
MKYFRKSTQNDRKSTFWFFFNSKLSKEKKHPFLIPRSDNKALKTIETGQKEIMKYLRKLTQNDRKSTFWFFFNS